MTAVAINTDNAVPSTGHKRANSEVETVSSQNTDSNAGGGRKKSLRVEDPQYHYTLLCITPCRTVARRAELVARISAIDEMVAKLQSTPETCDIYRQGLTSIEARRAQKLKAAEYRLGAAKHSIESAHSSTFSQLAKAEKKEFAAHSAMLFSGLAKSHQYAIMQCD